MCDSQLFTTSKKFTITRSELRNIVFKSALDFRKVQKPGNKNSSNPLQFFHCTWKLPEERTVKWAIKLVKAFHRIVLFSVYRLWGSSLSQDWHFSNVLTFEIRFSSTVFIRSEQTFSIYMKQLWHFPKDTVVFIAYYVLRVHQRLCKRKMGACFLFCF